MEFTEAVQTCLTKYFVFRGRARRSEYWYFALFCVLVRIASLIGDAFALGYLDHPRIGFRTLTGLLLMIPQLAVTVRRLHDTERSGWLVLALIVLAAADLLIVDYYRDHDGTILIGVGAGVIVVASAILFIIQFVLLVSAGTDGDNTYGSNPLAAQQAQRD